MIINHPIVILVTLYPKAPIIIMKKKEVKIMEAGGCVFTTTSCQIIPSLGLDVFPCCNIEVLYYWMPSLLYRSKHYFLSLCMLLFTLLIKFKIIFIFIIAYFCTLKCSCIFMFIIDVSLDVSFNLDEFYNTWMLE